MKMVISAKLKLNITQDQFNALRATQLAYRDALNFVSKYAFEHGKMSNKVALQDRTYDEIRARFHLPSQMACSVSRQVGSTKVDANYTSQACPMCGHTCEANRPDKGLLFVCQNCQYTLHADLVGARNIAMRTLLIRQDWMSTGLLSAAPDVSDKEAKAARLQRYAELRWSLDTSPPTLVGGI